MLVGHLCIFLGELCIQILCPFLNCVICPYVIKWQGFFLYSRYKSLIREIIGKYQGLSNTRSNTRSLANTSHFWTKPYTKAAGSCLLQVSNHRGHVTALSQSFLSQLPLRGRTRTCILEATIQPFQETNKNCQDLTPHNSGETLWR